MEGTGKISFSAAVLMSINIIIGAGIFFSPGYMAATAGSISFLGWIVGLVLLFPIIWAISQASRIFPGEGGFYNYCATGISPLWGFIAQWAYLIGYMGTAATIITVLREGLISILHFHIIAQHPYLFNAIIITIFSLLNLMTIEWISKVQSIATLLKMVPIFFVIVVFWFYWSPVITYNIADLGNIGSTIPKVMFAYWGFESCCNLSHLLKGGPGQIGKVVTTAFFIAAALYTIFHIGLMHVMGVQGLATAGATAFPYFMGLSPIATTLAAFSISGSILLSYANSIFGISLGNITNIYILAHKKLIAGNYALTRTNAQHRPTIAALIHGVVLWVFLLIITNVNVLCAFTNIGVSIAFTLVVVALLITFTKKKTYAKLPLAVLGIGSCGILIFLSLKSMSPLLYERFVYLIPVAAGLLVGLLLHGLSKKPNILKRS